MASLAFLAASCAGGAPPVASPATGATSGARLELRLIPGPSHSARAGFLFFGYTVQPQVAVWLESLEGDFIETIYVTAKGEGGTWMMAPKEGRPEALPVWYHLRRGRADAVSAATSPGETRYGSSLALPPGPYVVKLETNRSYDWNADYPKGKAGVSGQPSVVYRADIELGKGAAVARFEPVGSGSPDGTDGLVRPGIDGLTTALELFSSMSVAVIPE
jgi:hypothetical protein